MKSIMWVSVIAAGCAAGSQVALAADAASPAAASPATPQTRVEPIPLMTMPSSCLTDTGSQIKAAPGTCLMAVGHRYERKDLDSTGATTLGDAMSRLDPTLTVNRR